jgi:hypothetical protein
MELTSMTFEDVGGTKQARCYQEISVNCVMDAIAEEKDRFGHSLITFSKSIY